MSNQSLTAIKEIEADAQKIQKGYEEKVVLYQASLDDKISSLKSKYEDDIQKEIEQLEVNLKVEKEEAEQHLKSIELLYQEKSEAALNQQKEKLVEKIIDTMINRFTA